MLGTQAVEGEADETVHEEREDRMERAATTASSLEAEQDSGNIIRTQSMATLNEPIPQETGSGSGPRNQDTILGDKPAQTRFERLSKQSNDPPLSRVNILGSGEDNMKLNELIEICTKLSERVLTLENIKTTKDLEITNLKKRVKKLEKKKKSRTPQLKRRLIKVRIESSTEKSLGDQEDASKQGRNEIDQDEEISWFQEDAETQGRYGHDIEINTLSTSITIASINITTAEPVTTSSAPITTAGVSVSTAKPSNPPTTTTTFIEDEDLIIAQTLMKMRSVKSKETVIQKMMGFTSVNDKFQVTPKVLHLHAVKRIFRYLKGQPKLGLWYLKDSPFDLEAYTDSDYAGASLDKKSTTRGCQFLRSTNYFKNNARSNYSSQLYYMNRIYGMLLVAVDKYSGFKLNARLCINITIAEPVTTSSAPVTTAGVSVSTTEPSTPPITTILIKDEDLTIAQTLMKMRSMKSKEKSKEKGVSSETTIIPTRGVIMKEVSETVTRPIVPPQQQLDPKDKGQGIMQEPEKPVKVKGKDQIAFDEEVAQRLDAQMQAEYKEEERVVRQREEEDNLISWDNTQAMMEADYELAQRLQEKNMES
ncbi:hypothetical protein Tco_0205350 [Tanacetum coccineum]